VRHLRFTLQMHTDREERFALRVEVPRYGHGEFREEGSPIRLTDLAGAPFSLEGPAEYGTTSSTIGLPACSPSGLRFHGYEPRTLTVDLRLPARSRSSIAFRFETGRHAPWPGLSYRPTFVALRRRLDGQGTLGRGGTGATTGAGAAHPCAPLRRAYQSVHASAQLAHACQSASED
jgi:hypothetical protein